MNKSRKQNNTKKNKNTQKHGFKNFKKYNNSNMKLLLIPYKIMNFTIELNLPANPINFG